MKNHNIENLIKLAKKYRSQIFDKMAKVGSGHPGSIFSMLDMVNVLYNAGYVRKNEKNQMHDKVIISKGHAASALYPILVDHNIIKQETWENWGNKESVLRVFSNIEIPGIDATSGSLGHGLGIAAGYALSFKKSNIDKKIYVIISEGELYEGSIWESLLFINHYNLNNIKIIIDKNNLMILGSPEDCLKLSPIDKKFESFGFKTKEIDGHDYTAILNEFDNLFLDNSKSCIIANTIKGKGIQFFENKAEWHYWQKSISNEQIKSISAELKK